MASSETAARAARAGWPAGLGSAADDGLTLTACAPSDQPGACRKPSTNTMAIRRL